MQSYSKTYMNICYPFKQWLLKDHISSYHIIKMKAMQSIILIIVVNVLWYIKNEDLRKDLQIPSVSNLPEYCLNIANVFISHYKTDLALNHLYFF